MDAVTYPIKEVHDFINTALIPLRVPADTKKLADRFNVKWTPTLITLDAKGNEHHRTVGFLAPDALLPSLALGIAKTRFDHDDFGEALKHLDRLIKEYPECDQIPEALFLLGVSHYKNTHDPSHLKKAYEVLADKFSDNEWTKRAYPYRLL